MHSFQIQLYIRTSGQICKTIITQVKFLKELKVQNTVILFVKKCPKNVSPFLISFFLMTSNFLFKFVSQPVITCSKLTVEKLEQAVKYVQS